MVASGTVIVTGASGGLGSVVASVLALRGYDVVAQYRSVEPKIVAPDAKVRRIKADLTDEKQAAELIVHALGAPTPLWGVVNLAGGCINGMSWKLGADDFANVLEQNVITMHNVLRAAIPVMRDVGAGGRIVNVSSIVGETGAVGAAAYAAAKAAVVGYTKSLALELAKKEITANVINAGYFSAGLIAAVGGPEHVAKIVERIPLARLGTPFELAAAVEFLLRDDSRYITGQVLGVNGGMR